MLQAIRNGSISDLQAGPRPITAIICGFSIGGVFFLWALTAAASGVDDKQLKRAMKEASDGSIERLNKALTTLESACALQPLFFTWYVLQMSQENRLQPARYSTCCRQ